MRVVLALGILSAGCSSGWPAVPFEVPAAAPAELSEVEANAWQARNELLAAPEDEDRIIWYGRRIAYLGDYARAIEVYTRGLEIHPDSVRLLRHRGHRWISVREFDRAVEDLGRAAERIVGLDIPDEVEPDGIPNARNQPTSTLHTNVWYHLALAYYCRGEFGRAQTCWQNCVEKSGNPDMECAARYWLFHAATRAGDATAAAAALEPVRADWDVFENHAYHRLLLLYRGDLEYEDVAREGEDAIEDATLAYGLARWAQLEGREADALRMLRGLTASGSAAFGCIAAEADLARRSGARSAVPVNRRWLRYISGDGPAVGCRVVLIAGDEEYRSEEALPKLAECLARLGAECVVLFSQDPDTGFVDAEQRRHLPGLELLDDADLLILATRFRAWSDADMAHFVGFLARGAPVVGLRTATHAFVWPAEVETAYRSWGSDAADGGFGKRVLGESWVAHHGAHGSESTRGIHEASAAGHPVLAGVGEPWGPTDVYTVGELPPDATVLLRGSVRAGMSPDAPAVDDPRNAPMMPIAWTRSRLLAGGGTQRVFCSTMGSARDCADPELRRLLVQASLWALGLEGVIPEEGVDVRIAAADWTPRPFGFGGHRRDALPADLR